MSLTISLFTLKAFDILTGFILLVSSFWFTEKAMSQDLSRLIMCSKEFDHLEEYPLIVRKSLDSVIKNCYPQLPRV